MKAMFEAVCRALGGGKADPEMMLDRKARGELARAIEDFSNGKISAFEFDDITSQIRQKTTDITIHNAADDLWCLYDDIHDHKFIGGKEAWYFLERLRLILKSDGHYLVERIPWNRADKAGAMVIWCVLAALTYVWPRWEPYFGGSLFGFFFPWLLLFGVSVWIIFAETRRSDAAPWNNPRMTPFRSIAQIRAFHRALPGFAKRKFPGKKSYKVPFWQVDVTPPKIPWLDPIINVIGPVLLWFLVACLAPFVFPFWTLFGGDSRVDLVQPIPGAKE